LLRQGDHEKAIQMLAADALLSGKQVAVEALLKAYSSTNGSEKGFDDFKRQLRLKNAKTMEPFVLRDYQDEDFDFAGLDGKVVRLAFWFPT
jgi:hypothetical protein